MWKTCKDYKYIEINENGEIRTKGYSIFTNNSKSKCVKTYKCKVLKPLLNKRNGYLYVYVKNEQGKYKRVLIHRLVAVAFIPNPSEKAEVNHINGNKLDNRVENLEWVSREENIRHAYDNGLIDRKKQSIAKLKHKGD